MAVGGVMIDAACEREGKGVGVNLTISVIFYQIGCPMIAVF